MKKWYASKTLWINAAMGLLGLATVFVESAPIAPETAGMILTAFATVNGFLRTITTDRVSS